MPEWRCLCGDKTFEPGDGSGLGTIRGHILRMAEKGKHRCLGLWDDEDIQKVTGPNIRVAKESGLVAADAPENGGGSKEGQSSPAKGSGGPPKRASTSTEKTVLTGGVKAVVVPVTLVLPPSIQAYFAIDRARFSNNWEPTTEGMAQWISDIIEKFHTDHKGYIFGIDEGNPDELQKVERILRTIQGMDNPEEAQRITPPVPEEQPDQIMLMKQVVSTITDLANRIERLEGAAA